MTNPIDAPTLPPNHPDRPVDNQIAIEPEFKALAEAAEASGRTGEEVAIALLEVALGRIETRYVNLNTEEVLEKVTQRIEPASE